jgi:hypothetical protein
LTSKPAPAAAAALLLALLVLVSADAASSADSAVVTWRCFLFCFCAGFVVVFPLSVFQAHKLACALHAAP